MRFSLLRQPGDDERPDLVEPPGLEMSTPREDRDAQMFCEKAEVRPLYAVVTTLSGWAAS